jgi:hypothetical protein
MRSHYNIGLDSNCYTYLIDVMSKLQQPTDPLAEQRIALFRTFLYRKGGLWLTPTLRKEFEAIPSIDRSAFHSSWTSLFPETQPIDQSRIEIRVFELNKLHSDIRSCRILAEAEDAGLNGLLTFDNGFISKLSSHTQVSLQRPVEFWNSLGIPRGATPVTFPRTDNAMLAENWWCWI